MNLTSQRRTPLTVGIVGGSIAGCTAAIELLRAGHHVQVFERSSGAPQSRGAGIATPIAAIEALMDRDLIDLNMPYIHVEQTPHISRTSDSDRYGRTAWIAPMQLELFDWKELWRNLRKRLPDEAYHQGRVVTSAYNTDQESAAILLDGRQVEEFDLVIFADGDRSLGRRLIIPGADVRYRGYVLWRGLLDERELDDADPLEGMLCRVGYADGHATFSFVPGRDGSVSTGQRRVSWAMNVQKPELELPHFLVDRDGRRRQGSLPPGSMRLIEEQKLKQLAQNHLPPYYADIVTASETSYAQPIYTVDVPAYHRKRICLAGDAGSFAQPFTASGVIKSIGNAVDLVSALSALPNVDDALALWSAHEAQAGTAMHLLGQQLEEALIWSIPDFATMNESEMVDWWDRAAKPPPPVYPELDRDLHTYE